MEYPKYLLSLERATDRRVSAVAEMDQMFGVGGYELVDGVDCQKLRNYTDHHGVHTEDPEVIKRVEMELGVPLDAIIQQEVLDQHRHLKNNPGTVACSIGHAIILKRFLSANAPVAFIAEDDIVFLSHTTTEELDLIARHLVDLEHPAIAITYHHQQHSVFLHEDTRVSLQTTAMYNPKNPRQVWSTVGYFINRQAAKNILENMFPIHFVIDWFSVYLKRGWIESLWCTYPFLVKLSGAKSLSFEPEAASFDGVLAPVRIVLHKVAQKTVDKDVPVLAHLVKKRRDYLYPPERENNTFFV